MNTLNNNEKNDAIAIASLTPFSPDDLAGQKFESGHMLGGAQPLESAAPAPWEQENPSEQD